MSGFHNVVNQEYKQTGASKKHNELGMREMQARAYDKRDHQYILIKSPPASGKSRAMMFLGLDKLRNQGIKKVIVTVPETSIGRSFRPTELKRFGFYDDWDVSERYNLCLIGGYNETGKTSIFVEFVSKDLPADTPKVLICTHATFRHGFSKLMEEYDDISLFDNVLVGIDEFHHVSEDKDNVLGSYISKIMEESSAHIVAMTGSYFRGDSIPILSPEVESKFERVTYTYYEQLNGYEHLKTLGIGYHFYSNSYFDVLMECLDPYLKTIVYIPHVNSNHAEFNKYESTNRIIDCIADETGSDVSNDLSYNHDTGIHKLRLPDGRVLKIADLVNDDSARNSTQQFLSKIKHRDDVDIIIALGMAKEGFDWEYCEHVLTIGYRGSLTEVVQIIGRATRDSEGKSHAQFTNLLALPDGSKDAVTKSVNEVLKAISLSLLMEQVLKPKVNFKKRGAIIKNSAKPVGEVFVSLQNEDGSEVSDRVVDFLNMTKDEVIAELSEDVGTAKQAIASGQIGEDPCLVLDPALESIIRKKDPELSDEDVFVALNAIKSVLLANMESGFVTKDNIPDDAEIDGERTYVRDGENFIDIDSLTDEQRDMFGDSDIIRERDLPEVSCILNPNTGQTTEKVGSDDAFLKISNKFINTSSLPINLIDSVNPFHDAYEVISKTFDKGMFSSIGDSLRSSRNGVTEEEALSMYYKLEEFVEKHGRAPSITSTDATEVRLAEILVWLRNKKANQGV